MSRVRESSESSHSGVDRTVLPADYTILRQRSPDGATM